MTRRFFWYSLPPIPDKSRLGGENVIPANVTRQNWLTTIKNRDCVGCHKLGQESTRTIPAVFSDEKTSADAWMPRVQSGNRRRSWSIRWSGGWAGGRSPMSQIVFGTDYPYFTLEENVARLMQLGLGGAEQQRSIAATRPVSCLNTKAEGEPLDADTCCDAAVIRPLAHQCGAR
jgi:hypothetical protein